MKYLKRWGMLVWVLVLASALGIFASAAEGDLNLHIHKYEVEDLDSYQSTYEANGTEQIINDLTPLKNVKFRVQQVETSVPGSTDPSEYTPVSQGDDKTLPTDATGTASFTQLPQGIYLVTELDNEAVVKKAAPFLVSMPMTNPTGDGILSDVHVYPKNELEKSEIGKTVEQGTAG